jgi:hypothetical protein
VLVQTPPRRYPPPPPPPPPPSSPTNHRSLSFDEFLALVGRNNLEPYVEEEPVEDTGGRGGDSRGGDRGGSTGGGKGGGKEGVRERKIGWEEQLGAMNRLSMTRRAARQCPHRGRSAGTKKCWQKPTRGMARNMRVDHGGYGGQASEWGNRKRSISMASSNHKGRGAGAYQWGADGVQGRQPARWAFRSSDREY